MRTLVFVVMLALVATMANADLGVGFGVSKPGSHWEYSDVLLLAQVEYPQAPCANFSFDSSEKAVVVKMPGAVIRLQATTSSSNWKRARVGGQDPQEMKVEGMTRGDMILAEVSLDQYPYGIYSIPFIIRQRGSYVEVITLPIIGGVGKRGITRDDIGYLTFNLVAAGLTEKYPRVEDFSQLEVMLLCSNGGVPYNVNPQTRDAVLAAVNQVGLNLRVFPPEELAQEPQSWSEPVYSRRAPVEQFLPEFSLPPEPDQEPPTVVRPSPPKASQLWVKVERQTAGFRLLCGKDVKRVEYTLVPRGMETVLSPASWLTKLDANLTFPLGLWTLRVRGYNDAGIPGSWNTLHIPEGAEIQ